MVARALSLTKLEGISRLLSYLAQSVSKTIGDFSGGQPGQAGEIFQGKGLVRRRPAFT